LVVKKTFPNTTAKNASSGTTTQEKIFIIVMTAGFVELGKDWGLIISIAKFATFVWRLDFKVNINALSGTWRAIAPFVANTCLLRLQLLFSW
jgi:hypothetical protein